ncbi:hypothetical protein EMA8858_04159 [Emticicia aquatica]|uniref:Tetratricopeptide repeat protein n=1 Tax=Emticicia aquatica TaxID=1681835 RepID=A0ABN8EZF7_9BACT|nr:hypothetical protein [Emticicia aquatica]CAH0998024.1 hypothetical protein EMA8858_04159 [Emticicia aquatica]
MERFKNPTAYLIILGTILCLSFVTYYHYKPSALKIPLKDIDKHLAYQKEKGIESLEEYKQLLEFYPNSFEANYLLAKFYSNNQSKISSVNSNDVEKLLLKSWEVNSNFFDSNFMLAQIYYDKDEISKAEKFIKLAESVGGNNKGVGDLKSKIDDVILLTMVKDSVLHRYTNDVRKSLYTAQELYSYYTFVGYNEYYHSYIQNMVEDLDHISLRFDKLEYNGKIVRTSDIKKEYQGCLDKIIEKKKQNEIDRQISDICGLQPQKEFLTNRLSLKFRLIDIYPVEQLGNCKYSWHVEFYDTYGRLNNYRMTTGVNRDKIGIEVFEVYKLY